MNLDAARAAIFDDALPCDEARPAAFVPGALSPAAAHAACVRAESLLRALAIVEDSRSEEPEEHGVAELAMHRIEAKIDLLTALVARLAQREGSDPTRAMRWTARGVELDLDDVRGDDANDASRPRIAPGVHGAFRLQPSDWLPDTLTLPAVVLALEPHPGGSHAILQFDAVPAHLQAALERHLFRVHRRSVAERRRR